LNIIIIVINYNFTGGEKMAVKKKGEVFRCEVCGNVVEVKEVGGGELVCCGQAMKLITEE